jgi:integrase
MSRHHPRQRQSKSPSPSLPEDTTESQNSTTSTQLSYDPRVDLYSAEAKALTFSPIQPADGTEAAYMPALQYLAKCSTTLSRRSMAAALNSVARQLGYDWKSVELPDRTTTVIPPWQQLDWRTLNASNITASMYALKGAPNTRNRTLTVLRGVARHAWFDGAMPDREYMRIMTATVTLRDTGTREPMGHPLSPQDFHALMKACETDLEITRYRDAALLMIAACTGLRRSELAHIKLSDMTFGDEAVRITVIGKGNRQRHVFLVGQAVKVLNEWLERHAKRGNYVFCPAHPCNRHTNTDRPLSLMCMNQVLNRRVKQAGIAKVTWHDFRRGVGSVLIEKVGIQDAACQLGHRYFQTTRRYDLRGDRVLLHTAHILSDVYGGIHFDTTSVQEKDLSTQEDWVI